MDRRARLAHHAAQPVDVVTALRQQHEAGLFLAVPLAAHERVRLMPVADRLQMLDGDDVADRAGTDQVLQDPGVAGVAQNVADREHHARSLDRRHDVAAGLRGRRHRFLQQDVVLQPGARDRGRFVHGVLRADRHRVAHLGPAAELLPAAETPVRRDVVFLCQPVPEKVVRIRHRRDPQAVGILLGECCIAVPARARAEDGDGDLLRCHGICPFVLRFFVPVFCFGFTFPGSPHGRWRSTD